jgi:hypothetical protein
MAMRKRLMKNSLHLLSDSEDLADYGISIMGDDLDGNEDAPCAKTLDLFAVLSGPMGRPAQ